MNFLAYCFRAKNYYGMVDKQEYVVTPNVRQEEEYNAEAIRSRYLTDETPAAIESESTSEHDS